MKRRHQVVLFAVLLLSLTILSPSFDFRGVPQNQDQDQENDAFPNAVTRSENQQAPVEIVVSMSEREFQVFSAIAKQVAAARVVKINLRNLASDTYKEVLDNELAVGESGDVILLDSEEIQGYAKRGHLYPLNATTLSKALGDSVSPLREKTEWNGYQWGMPFDFDPYVLASRSKSLADAGLERLPQSLDEWTRIINQMENKSQKLLAINIDDAYAADAWLNEFGSGVAPSTLKTATESHITGGNEQALQVLNRVQPYIQVQNTNPDFIDKDMQEEALMVVTPFSQLVNNDLALTEDRLPNRIMFKPLAPVTSRSFVITSGSHEAEQASRWIEGMTSNSVQSDWYEQAHHLPGQQQQLNTVSQQLSAEGQIMSGNGREWFVSKTSETPVMDNPELVLQYNKKVQQFIHGEISANQYVNDMLNIQQSSK
ncbi:extracellular solute-binding protein [Paenibacillus sp. P13VS]|uniref:extracellular solute-binding protein n=1 Tax=Paenibacillus sp. P13VS TaxID=2697367 RepID=UPI00187BA04D|nr:extracellular solute-binding protein [Paenibacillus sp. P13VS]MBE7682131.1 extracellular solute-binding protein [Paenibacillus sp. P13VS]